MGERKSESDSKSRERREAVRKLAVEHARRTGEVVVLYRCSDYDFTTIGEFKAAGKADVEYIL
jgi:hypothetical protein